MKKLAPLWLLLVLLGVSCSSNTPSSDPDGAASDAPSVDTSASDTTPSSDVGLSADTSADLASQESAPPLDANVVDLPPFTCPALSGDQVGQVQTGVLGETSGIAASRTQSGLLWAHNDSGSDAEVHAITTAGQLRGTYRLTGVVADDWEDIAIGPGPTPGVDYLYVGDIGDNSRSRGTIVVYRFPEPQVPSGTTPAQVDITGAEAIVLAYPTTVALPPPLPSFGGFNAESLFVDPENGDLYIITKDGDGPEQVFRSAAPQDTTSLRILELVASFTIGGPDLPSTVDSVSGADISPTGDEVVVRNEKTAFIWRRGAGRSIASIFAAAPCVYELLSEPNGEAITYDKDKVLYTLSEGGFQPIHRYQR